ncbi:MAG: NADH-quinone oxidoreductase subunit N [Deltaproteobacteria bacterium]|nr:NADH-quinone oxidoreductase subunit N [Deltaproteobacteria bacterium]MBI4374072.1 NADH-quinone oxidoreductase subunit N [Deltaproteobacteria bacterium]
MASLQTINWFLVSEAARPLLILAGSGLVLLMLSAFYHRSQWVLILFSLTATLIAFSLTWKSWLTGLPVNLEGFFFDRFSYLLDLIFLFSLLVTFLFSRGYLKEDGLEKGEYYALLFFATSGLLLISHGADLIVIFLGIELTSFSTYILAGFQRGSIKSCEASLKYFVMGSFAAAFLLYGIALAYGALGTTSLKAFSGWNGTGGGLLMALSIAFLLIGIGFKIAAVPFHFWSPDVYEGAPTPITAFMATGVKAGGFAFLMRLALEAAPYAKVPWVPLLTTLSILTMTVGNLMALRQSNIKRMLAYSSIAHAGYALVGVTAAVRDPQLAESTLGPVLFYLFAYAVMTLGAFGVVVVLGRKEEEQQQQMKVEPGRQERLEISDYSGLAGRHPLLAALMALFMISLVGIPPTIGFTGKFYLFSGAVEAGLAGLVIVGVLNSAVSAYYYLAPVMKMFFQESDRIRLKPLPRLILVGIVLCLFALIYFGLFPSNLFLMAEESIRELSL